MASPYTLPSQEKFNENATGSVVRTIADKLADFVHVKDFGAVGNDSADDTTKIQAAIDSLPVGTVVTIGTISGLPFVGEQIVQGGGGVVRFEHGKTYKITSALQLPANVTLDLNWAVIKLYGASQNAIVRKHNAGLYSDNNLSARNGMIMSGDGAAGQNGIYLDTVDHAEFTNLWVRGFVGVGLWLKKCQYMVATKLRFTDGTTTGTGVRFDINADNYGSHENKIYGLFTEGCGIGAYISGFNNSIIGGSVSVSTTAGIKVEGLGSEGTQATHITGVKFEGSDTAFDILNLATHTAVTECMFIVPPTPANKTKRFIRQEAGDILITNCYSQASDLAISGSPAVIEHFGGKTRMQGGQFGVALQPEQLVVDETASRTSAKVTNNVFISARGDTYNAEDAFGTMSIRRASTTDSFVVGLVGESVARFDLLSNGDVYMSGNGTNLDKVFSVDGARTMNLTSGSGQIKLSSAALVGTRVLPTWGATVTCDANTGNYFEVVASSNAAHTITMSNGATGERVSIKLKNTSGGALAATGWNAVFKMAAWADPANGFSRSIDFQYDGTNWVEVSRTPADVPN